MEPRIAIVCDWLISRGGAERVIIELSRIYPEAPIFTSIYNPEYFQELRHVKVITSNLQKIPFARSKHHLLLPLMPIAFERFDLSGYDIVISSSHSCAKGVITKPGTLHICYCHSPMRYCWDGCHEYFERFRIIKPLRPLAQRMLSQLRIWDRAAAERVDHYIANSAYVAARIAKYYRKASTVIHPPVNTRFFAGKPEQGRYFLAVGRLTSYKRFDLLVDCFNELKLPLVIVGTGKDASALHRKAGRFITFTGTVSDEQLRGLYAKALALIFPQVEDFGITPIEAMSCGKPVIAYKEGGAKETIISGKTGMFFEEQNIDSIKKAVLSFSDKNWDSNLIKQHARQFDEAIFRKKISDFITRKWLGMKVY